MFRKRDKETVVNDKLIWFGTYTFEVYDHSECSKNFKNCWCRDEIKGENMQDTEQKHVMKTVVRTKLWEATKIKIVLVDFWFDMSVSGPSTKNSSGGWGEDSMQRK